MTADDLASKRYKSLDYGLIGNGQINALISPDGAIEWACMPSFDSASIFGAMMHDDSAGTFKLVPDEIFCTEQSYLKNTVILETQFNGVDIGFNVLDYIPRFLQIDDVYKPAQIHRLVEVMAGAPRVRVIYQPRLNFARGETEFFIEDGALVAKLGDEKVYLYTNLDYQAIINQDLIELTQGSFFIVSYNEPIASPSYELILTAFRRTAHYWRSWVKHCYLPQEYQNEIIRSALTLKMLVYDNTGAVIAAPTTSIPEIFGGNRTWDYRYCWLRDSYFIVNALMKLSQFEELEGFIRYLKKLLEDRLANQNTLEYIRPLYTIDCTPVPQEEFLSHWSGFNNSQPVRIGNNATTHFQNDIYGELILALFPMFFDQRIVRDDMEQLWTLTAQLVELSIEKFPEEDNGIWEFRNARRHYTFSKLMCWVGVDRGVKVAKHLSRQAELSRWEKIRDEMREDILTRAWNPEVQAFTQSYGGIHLDASTLLMPIYGFISAHDPRMKSTIIQSEKQLMSNGFAFRYTNEDDFGLPENAFTICTFWMIDALIACGEQQKAQAYFDNILRFSNPLGLFSEDLNPLTGVMTGNFPQGYTHVAIINTAMNLNNHNFYVV